jgi:hypothetical protein
MPSKPPEPQEEQAVEPIAEGPDAALSEEALDQAAGGAYPLPFKYNTGQGG